MGEDTAGAALRILVTIFDRDSSERIWQRRAKREPGHSITSRCSGARPRHLSADGGRRRGVELDKDQIPAASGRAHQALDRAVDLWHEVDAKRRGLLARGR